MGGPHRIPCNGCLENGGPRWPQTTPISWQKTRDLASPTVASRRPTRHGRRPPQPAPDRQRKEQHPGATGYEIAAGEGLCSRYSTEEKGSQSAVVCEPCKVAGVRCSNEWGVPKFLLSLPDASRAEMLGAGPTLQADSVPIQQRNQDFGLLPGERKSSAMVARYGRTD